MYTRADTRISTLLHPADHPDTQPSGLRAFFQSPYTITSIFFVLCVARILMHAMWRDELQAWSIATASNSLAELFHNFRYEGHPAGWFLILYALSRLTAQPVAMQLFHAVAATAVIYVVVRYAPFTWLQKILFTLGYFPFFEYAVVSRCYVIGILLFFIACAVFCWSKEKRLTLAVILFLMCQTSAYGIILAIAFAMMYAFDWAWDRWRGQPRQLRAGVTMACVAIFLIGMALAAYCMRPPADSGIATIGMPKSTGPSRLLRVVGDVPYGYVPLRIPNVKVGSRFLWFQVAIAIAIVIAAALVLARSPTALFLLICGTFGQLAFKYCFHPGATRHHGHLLILFVGAYWIREAMRETESTADDSSGILSWFDRNRKGLVIALFALNALAGVAAAGLEMVIPFSASREVARYIKSHYPADTIVVGDDNDEMTSPVAGHLGRLVYFPVRENFGSYIVWDNARRRYVPPDDVLRLVRELRARDPREIVLVLTHRYERPFRGLEFVKQFDRSVRREETYYLYHVTGDPAFTGPPTSRPRSVPVPSDPSPQ